MSATKKQLNKLVSEKMKNKAEKLKDCGDDLDQSGNVLADYGLYLSGAVDALSAAGIIEEDGRAFRLALDANEAELKLLEHKINLQNELSEESEDLEG